MRYHIVDIKGTVYGDFGKKAKAQAALEDILGAEPELKDLDLEVISNGTEEEDLAAELREMASFGWEKQEAYDNKEDFIERLGEVGKGFTEEEIFQTWENVWEQINDEMRENGMKNYRIKEEYLDRWGEDVTADYIVTQEELERLASEWEVPVEELLEQLEEID